eukprot:scaffold572_cov229-Amphora_coffeaeformis.AAC.3
MTLSRREDRTPHKIRNTTRFFEKPHELRRHRCVARADRTAAFLAFGDRRQDIEPRRNRHQQQQHGTTRKQQHRMARQHGKIDDIDTSAKRQHRNTDAVHDRLGFLCRPSTRVSLHIPHGSHLPSTSTMEPTTATLTPKNQLLFKNETPMTRNPTTTRSPQHRHQTTTSTAISMDTKR